MKGNLRLISTLAYLFLSFTSMASPIEDSLVGGTLTNRSTKQRLGVICSKKDDVVIGDVKTNQCVRYQVVLLNAKKDDTYVGTISQPTNPNDIKATIKEFDFSYNTSIYTDASIYYNAYKVYFYGFTASNFSGCVEDAWGWCLLLPFSFLVDTVATLGYHAVAATWEVLVGITAIGDQLRGSAVSKIQKKKMLKSLIFLVSGNKKSKNRNISNDNFNLIMNHI